MLPGWWCSAGHLVHADWGVVEYVGRQHQTPDQHQPDSGTQRYWPIRDQYLYQQPIRLHYVYFRKQQTSQNSLRSCMREPQLRVWTTRDQWQCWSPWSPAPGILTNHQLVFLNNDRSKLSISQWWPITAGVWSVAVWSMMRRSWLAGLLRTATSTPSVHSVVNTLCLHSSLLVSSSSSRLESSWKYYFSDRLQIQSPQLCWW